METFTIELNRPNKSVPWGLSIQGGRDFGCPLSVLRVTRNSIADNLNICVDDNILKINNIAADTLTHQQAILQIQNLQVTLELSRSGKTGFPEPPPIVDSFNNNCRISFSTSDLPLPPPELSNVTAMNRINKDIFYPPPPPVQVFNKDNNYEKITEPVKPNSGSGDQNNSKHFAAPPLKNNNEVPETNDWNRNPVGLGQFLQNQEPKRDKDIVVQKSTNNIPICFICKDQIKGTYTEANKKIYCSNHFCCSYCNKQIKNTQFIETKEGLLYCIEDFTNHIATRCSLCSKPIIEHQVMALGKCWHPNCFVCNHCKKPISQGQFHTREEKNQILAYCEKDYKEFYELKCAACKLSIDSDDKYVQVSNNNYHVECYKR